MVKIGDVAIIECKFNFHLLVLNHMLRGCKRIVLYLLTLNKKFTKMPDFDLEEGYMKVFNVIFYSNDSGGENEFK